MIDKLLGKAAAEPIKFAIGLGIVAVVAYYVVKKATGAAADAAIAIVAGDNALTHGTAYQDKGAIGTLAAAANVASGGLFESWGESLGSWIYDQTHAPYDPSTGLQSANKTVADGARATNALWGPVGSVELRAP